MAKGLPLKEVTINELYIGGEKCTYEIPIYQRNYAWEKDEIYALVQDTYDAYKKDASGVYYIGTLVSFHKGDRVYEVIDGQQRLTTIRLILGAFNDVKIQNKLTYRARKKSDETLKSIPKFSIEEVDAGIVNGYKYAKNAINDLVPDEVEQKKFFQYFIHNVHIIHYQVPKDIDLNHYFEIMNSRGEQLEKHEIVKANLMERLDNDDERQLFNRIWEACSEMNIYVQQNMNNAEVFGTRYNEFKPACFDDMLKISFDKNGVNGNQEKQFLSIAEILDPSARKNDDGVKDEYADRKDSFQPIIDFSNFLLIVLKISRMTDANFVPGDFNLDDKELLNEFSFKVNPKTFAFNLLKARFLLDNYVVHHSREEDTIDNNPWKLQIWQKDDHKQKGYPKNIFDTDDAYNQDKLVHLLSMFEVSFTARQRKNYLFYCLLFLMKSEDRNPVKYAEFVEDLANRYYKDVYLEAGKLNAINTPLPGSFDETILVDNAFTTAAISEKTADVFVNIYGDGTEASNGIPLFVFNYLDFKLWDFYANTLRGEKARKDSADRKQFFEVLGCSDFGLDIFNQFYFSRTRRSLEHYYPQANATGEAGALDQNQINCLGNYAMIGSEANSSGSNWDPLTKLTHYMSDHSGKISQISVASLKFVIMMQICKDNQSWLFENIQDHQERMIKLLCE